MSERTCANCRWHLQTTSTGVSGECRRHPPTGGRKGYGSWPSTDSTYWCGEWADKAITPEQEQRRERALRVACAIMANEHAAGLTSEQVWARAVHFAAIDPERLRGGG